MSPPVRRQIEQLTQLIDELRKTQQEIIATSRQRTGWLRRAGGGGVTFWRFTLNADWSSGVAAADILNMDGTDTGTDANVNDPLSIFADLGNGDAGICFLQDGLYYVIQAPCPA